MLSTVWALIGCVLLGAARADEGADPVEDAVQLIQQQLPEPIDEDVLYQAINEVLHQRATTGGSDQNLTNRGPTQT